MNINLNYKNLFDYLTTINVFKQQELKNAKINTYLSSNLNWVIELLENKSILFIKQTLYFEDFFINNKIDQEWSFYNLSKSTYSSVYISDVTPELVYFDQEESILIYKLSNDYQSLKSYCKKTKQSFNLIAELIGKILGRLHCNTIKINKFFQNRLEYQISYPDPLYNKLVNLLQPKNLKTTPTQAWRFLGMFHTSHDTREIVTKLILDHRKYCLTHNNIKFDNLFISKYFDINKKNLKKNDQSFLKIINWENCCWGDPACDLGRAVTIYFLFWFDSMLIDTTIDIKQSIQLATIPFEIINYSITTMIKAYLNANSQILENYPDFLSRVIQFAGLGLIYQLLTELQFQPEIALEHQNLYFYIASQLICKPQKFISV